MNKLDALCDDVAISLKVDVDKRVRRRLKIDDISEALNFYESNTNGQRVPTCFHLVAAVVTQLWLLDDPTPVNYKDAYTVLGLGLCDRCSREARARALGKPVDSHVLEVN